MTALVRRIVTRSAWLYPFQKPVLAMALYSSFCWLTVVALVGAICKGQCTTITVVAGIVSMVLNFGTCFALIRRENKAQR